jgi:hypothetical protein
MCRLPRYYWAEVCVSRNSVASSRIPEMLGLQAHATKADCLQTLWGMAKSDACPDDGVRFSLRLGTVASALFLLGERQNQGPTSAFYIPSLARCMRERLGASDCARTRFSGGTASCGPAAAAVCAGAKSA